MRQQSLVTVLITLISVRCFWHQTKFLPGKCPTLGLSILLPLFPIAFATNNAVCCSYTARIVFTINTVTVTELHSSTNCSNTEYMPRFDSNCTVVRDTAAEILLQQIIHVGHWCCWYYYCTVEAVSKSAVASCMKSFRRSSKLGSWWIVLSLQCLMGS